LCTAKVLQGWNDGKFQQRYRAFHKAIADCMPPDQTPNYFRVGERNPAFESQSPCTI
jgi:hypothetical protein